MRKYTFLAIGALFILLALGGVAYAAGEGGGADQAKVDINTATIEELQTVPGLDQELAQNIIDYREANGPFSSVDELISVEGIDNEKLDVIREQIMVGEMPGSQPMGPPQEPDGMGDQPMGEPMPGESPPAGY
ncbi:MAG: ComEA family DNA-binding protein [Desulfomonilia bacterium]|jgi:comEA protein|uniref:ComE operon protein 1 n=1 Tax=anaerobic digester metagenome TaxID=1263854 RepID=A0A485M2A9_9ZZZZ|nr:helix-hairpin-helix domain-containing protein [Pseudomonadota bacterium]HON37944.1 helix-hairpin-helix domain-containing protein [Deltaproteobacteria bacterium]HRS56874.1 helix-hairpin-helix domain-containing protein [Desulfomonilia bacterium]HPD22074.1 helix-hairpin-helix domain-containing protein [Deltaproteobacteria bacterium]HPX18883.1 helix-hairpin-helix domain-containing protein [Deltaproteobacteria bacterium]